MIIQIQLRHSDNTPPFFVGSHTLHGHSVFGERRFNIREAVCDYSAQNICATRRGVGGDLREHFVYDVGDYVHCDDAVAFFKRQGLFKQIADGEVDFCAVFFCVFGGGFYRERVDVNAESFARAELFGGYRENAAACADIEDGFFGEV